MQAFTLDLYIENTNNNNNKKSISEKISPIRYFFFFFFNGNYFLSYKESRDNASKIQKWVQKRVIASQGNLCNQQQGFLPKSIETAFAESELEFNGDGSIDTNEDRGRWLFSSQIVVHQPEREGTFEI
jgi:hypothetical protein